MNIHTPERGANESRKDYVSRRASSRAVKEQLSLTGKYKPSGRRSPSSREMLRDSQRASGAMAKRRRFADVYLAHVARTYRMNKGMSA